MMIDDEERVKKIDDDLESSNQPSSRPSYIPSHMPPFPSKHTYKKTPVCYIYTYIDRRTYIYLHMFIMIVTKIFLF